MKLLNWTKPVPKVEDSSENILSKRDRARGLRQHSSEECKCIWIDRKGRHQAHPIEILDRSDGGLGFRVSRPFVPGQLIWVETGQGLRGVVRYCELDRKGYRVGLILIGRERRRSDREPMMGAATLFWAELPGCWIESPSLIRDVSDEGMQLQVPTAVPVSTVVRLEGVGIGCEGITRYCQPKNGLFLVGIEFLGRPKEKITTPTRENGR